MTTPQRADNGIVNIGPNQTMSQFLAMDESRTYGYFNDFFQYAATDWVLSTTEAGAGSATEAISDTETGGGLLITNAAGDGDHDNFQLSKDGGTNDSESFVFATGKKAWFKVRLKTDDADKATLHAGLYIANTDPVNAAPSDGMYFKAVTATGVVSFIQVKNSLSSTSTGITTLADATFIELGFYWDGVDSTQVFVNDVLIDTVASGTTLPDDEYLAVSFAVENGEAVAHTMTVDYIGAWMER